MKEKFIVINNITYKLCIYCNKHFPHNEEYFYKNNSSKDGFQSRCKECAKKRQKECNDKRRIERAEKQREYYYKNRDYYNEHSRNWNRNHREFFKEYNKNYLKSNPEKSKIYNQRHASKNHIISKKEWKACKEYFNYSCAYCGMTEEVHKTIYGQQLHKEHVVCDGSVYLDNCVPSCLSCNVSKWKYDLDEWYNENNGDYTEERKRKIKTWLSEDYKKHFEGFREKRKYKNKT